MKKHIVTRIISFLGALILVVSGIPTPIVNAASTYTGLAGVEDVNWTLEVTDTVNPYGYKDAYLTLTGKGKINYPFMLLQENLKVNIRSVDIKNGVTVIGSGAFSSLVNCHTVNIPNSVVSIEGSAFEECFTTGERFIVIPSSVQTIGDSAFQYNWGLNKVYIDSPAVAKNLNFKNDCGYLVAYADTVYVLASIKDVGSYLTDEFALQGTTTYNGKTYNAYGEPCKHTYTAQYYNDQQYHWHVCTKCGGKVYYETHNEYSLDDKSHVCFDCGYKSVHSWENNVANSSWYHGTACKRCGYFKDYEYHIFDNDCDTTCDTCGYTRTITHKYFPDYVSDDSYHWYECEVCGDRQEHSDHVWEDECDTACDICGYLRTVSHSYTKWTINSNEHWHTCEICYKKTDVAEHEYDGNVCVVCDFDITEGSFYAGTGTEADPYIIKDISSLMYFAKMLNKTDYSNQYIKLSDDITLNDETFTFLADSGLVKVTDGTHTAYLGTGILGAPGGSDTFDTVPSEAGVWYESEDSFTICEYGGELNEWSPIGKNMRYVFRGTFIGSGHTISGLYINSTSNYVGFFGHTFGNISSIFIKNAYVRGNDEVGSVVGDGGTAEISNCYSNATVCGNSDVAGIAGGAASVSDCRNEGTVSGESSVAGIVSLCTTVSGCYNSGNIYGSGSIAGVVVQGRTVSDCGNIGKITSEGSYSGAAGIICRTGNYYDVPQITNCMNSGDVSGSYYVGGIVGYSDYDIAMSDCYNFGNITGTRSVAGILAQSNGLVEIERCANTGTISGEEYVGGIAGDLWGSSSGSYIKQSYNKGAVTASKEKAAGIVSNVSDCKISDCYNTGAITGNSTVGGIVGEGGYSAVHISTCYSSGTVCTTGNHNTAGGISAYAGISTIENCYYLAGSVTICENYPSNRRSAYGIGGKDSDTAGVTTALSSYDMKKYSNYTGFDFSTVWSKYNTPTLQAINHTGHNTYYDLKNNDSEHWWTCYCGLRSDINKHIYTDACDTTCDCGYVREIIHDFSDDWTCYDDSVHAQVCSVCGEVRYSIAHDYTNACDSTCNTCGYVRTPPHAFSGQYSQNELTHWLECSSCGLKKELGSHEYKDECDKSCNKCSYERIVTHSYNSRKDYDTSVHWYTCSNCKATSTKTEHVLDNACDEKCNDCGYSRSITHSYESEWIRDEDSHWHKCSICGAESIKDDHAYDNACDTVCNECGHERTITHDYNAEWTTTDEAEHWHECSVCGDRIDVTVHIYDNACDTGCNECGHERTITHDYKLEWTTDETEHWHECSLCGDTNDIGAHEYDNACDTVCNVCEYERTVIHDYKTEWAMGEEEHWHECSLCGDRTDVSGHEYDNACDTVCNVCEYERTITHDYKIEWAKDEGAHWHVCSVCGDRTDVFGHEYDNACDTICNVCEYERTITHDYKSEWTTDEGAHWHECSVCGAPFEKDKHADTDNDGYCDICKKSVYIVGDINFDGNVDISDAMVLFQHSMLPDLFPITYPGRIDFNSDGNVDISDAMRLFQHSMLPDLFPLF